MNIVVRMATDDDAGLIAGLTRAAWAGKVAASSSGHRETAPQVLAQLRHGGGCVLLADGEAVGSVRWAPHDSAARVWEIMRMGVLPAWRGTGLARYLLEAVIRQARDCAVEEVRLAVRADQPKLLDFYAAFDFTLAAELEYSHANAEQPAPTVMRRCLRG
ncbi:MAG: GNAT family N-acetyltransferase [Pseudomonadota bacterium]